MWLGLKEVVGIGVGVLARHIAELQFLAYAIKPVVGFEASSWDWGWGSC